MQYVTFTILTNQIWLQDINSNWLTKTCDQMDYDYLSGARLHKLLGIKCELEKGR